MQIEGATVRNLWIGGNRCCMSLL